MAYGTTIRRSERYLALGAVVALHAGALLFLVLQRSQEQPRLQEPGPLKVIALSASSPAQPPPPPRTLPSRVVLETMRTPAVTSSEERDASAAPMAAAGCAALEAVRETIASDPAAMASALNAPPETRSIAEAIVIWNGEWAQAASTLQSPLAPTRWAVERSVASMSAECLDEPVTGPRLIPFPSATGTMFLVFGSGTWKWRDIADDVVIGTAAAEDAPAQGPLARVRKLVGLFDQDQ